MTFCIKQTSFWTVALLMATSLTSSASAENHSNASSRFQSKFSDWSYAYFGRGTASMTAVPSGGNPGPHLEATNDVVEQGNGEVSLAMWNDDLEWDPRTLGPLVSVTLQIDVKWVSGGQGTGHELYPMIRQANEYYILTGTSSGQVASWRTVKTAAGYQNDFCKMYPFDASRHPDFSSNGSMMTLGFAIGNSGEHAYSATAKYDNWQLHLVGMSTGFQDGEFGGWSQFAFADGNSSAVMTVLPSGGNPGALIEASTDFVGDRGVYLAMWNDGNVWDPAVRGELGSVTMQIDARWRSGGAGAGQSVWPLIIQNGRYYARKGSSTGQDPSWRALQSVPGYQNDFTQIYPLYSGGPPSFEEWSAPMTFGFVVASTGFNPYATTVDYDNWQLALNAAGNCLGVVGVPRSGESLHFELTGVPHDAGSLALVLLSCSGTTGFRLRGGPSVPIVFDACTSIGLTYAGLFSAPVSGSGMALTPSVPFPLIPPQIAIYAAAVTLDVDSGRFQSTYGPISFVTE